jgi:hypothetical protein
MTKAFFYYENRTRFDRVEGDLRAIGIRNDSDIDGLLVFTVKAGVTLQSNPGGGITILTKYKALVFYPDKWRVEG